MGKIKTHKLIHYVSHNPTVSGCQTLREIARQMQKIIDVFLRYKLWVQLSSTFTVNSFKIYLPGFFDEIVKTPCGAA